MRENRLRRMLAEGRPAVGCYIQSADPFTSEMMGLAGFDFLLVDTEHSPIDVPQLLDIMIALRGSPSTVIVRAIWNDPVNIKRILDTGPEGIIVPWVNTAEECRAAVAACKYPPQGIRGFGPRRAFRVLADGNLADYAKNANDNVSVFCQIETIGAVERLDDILKVPGLDGVMIGPADLSGSIGRLPDIDHPDVDAVIQRVSDKCRQHGVAFGMFTHTPERARKWMARGCRIATVGGDLDFVFAGIQRAKGVSAELKKDFDPAAK